GNRHGWSASRSRGTRGDHRGVPRRRTRAAAARAHACPRSQTMTTKVCSAREAGLTLVELLVVLAVLGLISGLLITGLHSAAMGWPRVVRGNADNEERQATRRMLNQVFAQIYPARLDKAAGGFVQFTGERDRADFLAPLARRFGTDD